MDAWLMQAEGINTLGFKQFVEWEGTHFYLWPRTLATFFRSDPWIH